MHHIGFFKAFLAVSVLQISVVQASPLAELPSVIPLENLRPEATDIVVNGVRLLPSELATQRDRGVDISKLDPDDSTDLWRPAGDFLDVASDDSIVLRNETTVKFVDTIESPLKTFRFLVQDEGDSRGTKMYQVFVAKRAQTYLLRRNLMRRLGYYVPPMKRLEKLRIEFPSVAQRENFIHDKKTGLKWNALGDQEWILNLEEKDAKHVDLQDVVILPAREEIVNLAFGVIRPDINQGRRIVNALIIPFNLVDVRESINGFRWHSAQIKSNVIYLPLEDEEGFTTTLADARWIMRKILVLDRADWQQIVSGIGYPEPAEKLLVEKLISRRNELARLLKMNAPAIVYDYNVSFGEDLKEGELLRTSYPGLAPRLAMEELSSLISGAELTALFKSKVVSTAIGELVRQVNVELLPRTDIEKIRYDKEIDAFFDDLIKFFKTGKRPKRQLGIWSTPYYQGQFIASREVIAGSYLGTDNRVQLVDTIGVGIESGLYFGTVRFGPKPFADAKAKVSYIRTYSHLKPLTSIKTALKEPFKNILVPALRREWAGVIDPEALVKKEGQDEKEWADGLKKMVDLLKENLQNGESLIISDNIGTGAQVRGGYRFHERITAQAQFDAGLMVLSRLHIQRAGDQIHIYKDFGNMKSLQFVISLRAGLEVLDVRAKLSTGSARTDFYQLDLNDKLEENPDLPLALGGVRDILLKSSVKKIDLFAEPHRLEHKLEESQQNVNFLFWNHFNLNTEDRLKLTRAHELEPEYYLRRLMGTRNGNDYQTLGVEVVNEIIAESSKQPVQIPNQTTGDPGDTLFGKSKARYAYFEAELDSTTGFFKESFVGVVYRWKGWSANKKHLSKIIKEFSDRFEFQFYHPVTLHQVKKAELYTMNLRIFIYNDGIWNITYLPLLDLKRLLDQNNSFNGTEHYKADRKNKVILSYYKLQNEYQKALSKKHYDDAGDKMLRLASLLESSLNQKGLIEAVGGLKNILVQPILTGFFKGEDGKLAEMPIEGNEIGQIGAARALGPMTSTQTELGMTESEFFVYWLIGRI